MASPMKCSVRSSLAPPSFWRVVGFGCLGDGAAGVEVGAQFALDEAAQVVGHAAIFGGGLLAGVVEEITADGNAGGGLIWRTSAG